MKFAIVFLVSIAIGCAWASLTYDDVLNAEFENFKLAHNKAYRSKREEMLRTRIFKDNKMIIDDHNERFAAGETTYRMGVNKFTDLLPEEFQKLMLMADMDVRDARDASINDAFKLKNTVTPGSVDWRESNAVTPVKNQGACGSCWAFSATGALEGQNAIKGKGLVSLSEQNLIDCSTQNYGCGGGWPKKAYEYIMSNGGIDTEVSYPYNGRQGRCHFNRNTVGARVSQVVQVVPSEEQLQLAVAKVGPVSVLVDASSFQHYKDGIFDDPNCHRPMNHAVLVVGYGPDYWIIKNSWSTSWGEQGYMRMARNKNLCHIADQAYIPIV